MLSFHLFGPVLVRVALMKTNPITLSALCSIALFAVVSLRTEAACISPGDLYDEPVDGLELVDLPIARVLHGVRPGSPSVHEYLAVADCGGSPALDIVIPWSDPSAPQPAVIQLKPTCDNRLPRHVKVTFSQIHEKVSWFGVTGEGRDAGTQATEGAGKHALFFDHTEGMQTIVIEGEEICIHEICTGCEVPPRLPSGAVFLRGDANRDGQIDISDVVTMLSFLFAGLETPGCLDAVDSNDDGGIDIADAVRLLAYLFAGAPPPPGGGTCQADLTHDSLDCVHPEPCQQPDPSDTDRWPVFLWLKTTPRHPVVGRPFVVEGRLAGASEVEMLSVVLDMETRDVKGAAFSTTCLPVSLSENGSFRTSFTPKKPGSFTVTVTGHTADYMVSDGIAHVVGNTGIPEFDSEPLDPDDPVIEPITDPVCVEYDDIDSYPDGELISVQMRDGLLTDVLQVMLNRFLDQARAGELPVDPVFFQNSEKDFETIAALADYFGFDMTDEIFAFDFDMLSLLCATGEFTECDEEGEVLSQVDELINTRLTGLIEDASFQIDWDTMVSTIQVEVADDDPNVTLDFSGHIPIDVHLTLLIQGTLNPVDPSIILFKVLFPDPMDPAVRIDFDLSDLMFGVRGTAELEDGQIQDITVEVIPSATDPWEINEVQTAFLTTVADILFWYDEIFNVLVAAPLALPPVPGTEVYQVVMATPLGPLIAANPPLWPIAVNVIRDTLWNGTCDPDDDDCDVLLDVTGDEVDFQGVLYYGLYHVILSYATTLLQDQVNGLLEEVDFMEYVTQTEVSHTALDYTFTIGPERMNDCYPSELYHVLGGRFGFETLSGGGEACLGGSPPSVTPSVPSDYLSIPVFEPPWDAAVPDWDTSININQKLLQTMLNEMAEDGLFCSSWSGEVNSMDVTVEVVETAYPQLSLQVMPYAVPLSFETSTSITAGTITFEETGAPGVTLQVSTNTGMSETVELDLEADLVLELEHGLLHFGLSDLTVDNLDLGNIESLGNPVLVAAVVAAVNMLLADFEISTGDLWGFEGIELPFGEHCIEIVGYGSWNYCDDYSERALALLIHFDETFCGE